MSTVLSAPVGVMLLTPIDVGLAPQFFPLSEWAAQPKYDGDRLVLHREGLRVWAQNRDKVVKPVKDPLVRAIQELPGGDLVLDGELVGGTTFVAFDMLYHSEMDLRTFNFAGRWQHLLRVVPERGPVQRALTVWDRTEKEHLYRVLQREGQEGIVFRRRDAKYTVGRQPTAVKVKFWKTLTAIVLAHNETYQTWQEPPFPFEVRKMDGKRSIQCGVLNGSGRIVNTGDVSIPGSRPTPPLGSLVEIRYIYAFRDTNSLFHPTLMRSRTDVKFEDCAIAQLKYKGEGV